MDVPGMEASKIIEISDIEFTDDLSETSANVVLLLEDTEIAMLSSKLHAKISLNGKVIKKGDIGNILIEGNKVTFEIKNLFYRLSKQVTKNYAERQFLSKSYLESIC
jgi:hypothetical protein